MIKVLILSLLLISSSWAANLNNICEVHSISYLQKSKDSEGEYDNCVGTLSTGLVISTDSKYAFILTDSHTSDKTIFNWAKVVEPFYIEDPVPENSLSLEGKLIQKDKMIGLALYKISRPNLKFQEIKFGEPTDRMALVVKNYNLDNRINKYKTLISTYSFKNFKQDIVVNSNVVGGGVLVNYKNQIAGFITNNNNKKSWGPTGKTIESFLQNIGKKKEDICPPAPIEK